MPQGFHVFEQTIPKTTNFLCIVFSFLSSIEFLLLPTALLALILNHEFSVMEVLWTFSIYLESVAILPQLFMVSKTGEAESITSHYLFALGSYRALYILNWIYRYYFEGPLILITLLLGFSARRPGPYLATVFLDIAHYRKLTSLVLTQKLSFLCVFVLLNINRSTALSKPVTY